MLKVIYRLLGPLFIGFLCSIWIIQNNEYVEKTITHSLLQLLEHAWDVSIDVQKTRINFFTMSFFLEAGTIRDNNQPSCQWNFDRAKIHVSPIGYLMRHKACLYVTINNIAAKTHHDGYSLDIIKHIKKIITPPLEKKPVSLCRLNLNNFNITTDYHGTAITCLLTGSFDLSKKRFFQQDTVQRIKQGILSISHLDILVNNTAMIEQAHGSYTITKNTQTKRWESTINIKLPHIALDKKNEYVLDGTWNDHEQTITIRNAKDSTQKLSYSMQHPFTINLQGTLPIALIYNACTYAHAQPYPSPDGMCTIDVNIPLPVSHQQPTGSIRFNNLSWNNVNLGDINLILKTCNQEEIHAYIEGYYHAQKIIAGSCFWNFIHHKGMLSMSNVDMIKAPSTPTTLPRFQWYIKPQQCTFTLEGGASTPINGNYAFFIHNLFKGESCNATGTYTKIKDDITISGKTDQGEYNVGIKLSPTPHINTCIYTVQNRPRINLNAHPKHPTMLHGDVYVSFLRSFTHPASSRYMLGGDQASFYITIDQKDLQHITGSFALHNGKIYLPDNRNLIEHFSSFFEYNAPHKIFSCKDINIIFCKGIISSKKLSVHFDDSYGISMIHAPFSINDLFINWKQDFYGLIYGNILCNKLPDKEVNLTGSIILKKALLKDNIFSKGVSSSFSHSIGHVLPIKENFKVDMHILTEQPIKAKTHTLETFASVDLRVRYNHNKEIMQIPSITGVVSLDHGHLQFLRNKLNIDYGKIHFIENQLNDPMIDLIASNRINKYMVTLQATGSLEKPTIMLESNPELTEEQVVGLLLAGSENARLQTDLFSILEQNLHNIVLGSKDKLPKSTSILQTLTRPFKYVQITPDFTDQSGRGGIKGTLSINVNDQVHAQIQKNFNLQEDFSAQIEYLLADDVNIKAVKDQRGELGAEVEVRLKF